jgi:hypothetical protein
MTQVIHNEGFRTSSCKWVVFLSFAFALMHLFWCFSVDAFVWHYLDANGFSGIMNPFGMALAPYVPGCAVLQASTKWGIGSPVWLLGVAIVMLASFGVGMCTAYAIMMRIRERTRSWGRYRWRFYIMLLLWFGWFTVPTELSLCYQWYHWTFSLGFWGHL